MRNRFLLVLILLLAFVLRVKDLELNPLWFDEAMEYWVATSPLDEMLQGVKIAIQDPPLYSIALHFWMAIGKSEFTLRLFSTVASLLSIAGIYVLGTRVHSTKVGLVAALLLALIPPDIRFAQEVGQYAFLTLTLVFFLLALSFALQTNAWKHWIAWCFAGLAGIYVYYGSLLVIVPIAVMSFVIKLVGSGWRYAWRQAAVISAAVVLAIPLLVSWLPDQLLRGPTADAFSFQGRPLLTELEIFLTQTRDVMAYQLTGFLPEPESWVVLSTIAWLLVSAALLFVIRKSSSHRQVLLWLAISWGLYYLAGRVGAYPYGGTRHALILTPLIVLSMAIGIVTIWQMNRIVGLAVLPAIAIVALLAPGEPPEDMRTLAEQWIEGRNDNIPTYIYYGAAPAFRYQIERLDKETEAQGAWYRDCWAGRANLPCSEDNIYSGRWIRQRSPEEKIKEITAMVGSSASQFWLIPSHTGDSERQALLDAFDATYATVGSIEATGTYGYLLEP